TPGKENDFFNVNEYPGGTFLITKVTRLEGDEEANHMVYGNLKLKGISKNIGFRAQIETQDNLVIVTTPLFTIDRTLWELNHRSGKFFDNLGDNLIRDEIGLAVNLVAAAEPAG
ncbi:MAG: YceI family protein, partial [Saprospiraceae bacterium]|nr:YceI family protein [Saprospiraceae bacterium]